MTLKTLVLIHIPMLVCFPWNKIKTRPIGNNAHMNNSFCNIQFWNVLLLIKHLKTLYNSHIFQYFTVHKTIHKKHTFWDIISLDIKFFNWSILLSYASTQQKNYYLWPWKSFICLDIDIANFHLYINRFRTMHRLQNEICMVV